jgi:hypothetical protein
MTPGQRGRRIGRAIIALAVVVGIILPAWLFVAAPGHMGGDWGTPLWYSALPWVGMVGVVVGLVWMVRIHRADPEPDQKAWRYRSKR